MDLTDVVVYVATLEEYESVIKFAVQKGHDIIGVRYNAGGIKDTCLHFNSDNLLTYSDKSWYESEGYNVISYEGFMLANSAKPVDSNPVVTKVSGIPMTSSEIKLFSKNILNVPEVIQSVGGNVTGILSKHLDFVETLSRNGVTFEFKVK